MKRKITVLTLCAMRFAQSLRRSRRGKVRIEERKGSDVINAIF
jgi:hypothetical protein